MDRFVFISYSRADRQYVDKLENYLLAARVPVWYDRNIVEGDFRRAIEERIQGCVAFVPVISETASQSNWVRDEIAYARASQKPILPLLLAQPRESLIDLIRLQHEDVTGGRLPGHIFVDNLRRHLAGNDRRTAPGQPPTTEVVDNARHYEAPELTDDVIRALAREPRPEVP